MSKRITAVENRLGKQLDLLSVPNQACPHVSNDHPPTCMQDNAFSCTRCPEYLDGITDISMDENLMTENMKWLKYFRNKRDSWDDIIAEGYRKRNTYLPVIEKYERLVREEQGR